MGPSGSLFPKKAGQVPHKKGDDAMIDLRGGAEPVEEEPEFQINYFEDDEKSDGLQASSVSEEENSSFKAHDKVKVKFDKFVNLVANHAYEEIFQKHAHEDIILSTDLLTDLANAHEEKPDGKKTVPFIFAFGLVLGIAITWLLLKY